MTRQTLRDIPVILMRIFNCLRTPDALLFLPLMPMRYTLNPIPENLTLAFSTK